jgi:hypothetical protein
MFGLKGRVRLFDQVTRIPAGFVVVRDCNGGRKWHDRDHENEDECEGQDRAK